MREQKLTKDQQISSDAKLENKKVKRSLKLTGGGENVASNQNIIF